MGVLDIRAAWSLNLVFSDGLTVHGHPPWESKETEFSSRSEWIDFRNPP